MRETLQNNREMRPLLKDSSLWLKIPIETQAAIEVVLSAYKSHRNAEGYAYLSMPITSGKLFYEVLDKHKCKNLDELMSKNKDILYDEIIRPNIDINTALADEIAQTTRKTIIAPAVFEAKKQRWSQEAYMYMWYRVLEEMVDETIMTDGWEYSNGGTQELVRANEIKFNFALTPRSVVSHLPSYLPRSYWPVFKDEGEALQYNDTMEIKDQDSKIITLHNAAGMISDAIIDLRERGFEPSKLENTLYEIGGLAECYEYYKNGWMDNHIDMPWDINYKLIYGSIRNVKPHFESCSEYRDRNNEMKNNREKDHHEPCRNF